MVEMLTENLFFTWFCHSEGGAICSLLPGVSSLTCTRRLQQVWLRKGLRLESTFVLSALWYWVLGSLGNTWQVQWNVETVCCHKAPKELCWCSGHNPFYCSTVGVLLGQESLSRPRWGLCLKTITNCCGCNSCKCHANPPLCRVWAIGFPPLLS